jgi:hypothetical protein
MTNSHAVYNGQTFAGSISSTSGGIVALDAVGNELGVFKTRTEAVRAVLSPPAPPVPPAEKSSSFDAENALRRAIEALARECEP